MKKHTDEELVLDEHTTSCTGGRPLAARSTGILQRLTTAGHVLLHRGSFGTGVEASEGPALVYRLAPALLAVIDDGGSPRTQEETAGSRTTGCTAASTSGRLGRPAGHLLCSFGPCGTAVEASEGPSIVYRLAAAPQGSPGNLGSPRDGQASRRAGGKGSDSAANSVVVLAGHHRLRM